MREAKEAQMKAMQKVWIDADTGNETDDAYAIVRMLVEPTVEVAGLSSVHFNNADLLVFERWNQYPTQNIQTAAISQQLNEEILRLMRKEQIPHPLGADRQIGRAWGGTEPRPSPATEMLLRCVRDLRPEETVDVLCLGALTNIASAFLLEPALFQHIRLYTLGAKYDARTEAWDKNEFNIRNDLNAFDCLLNDQSVDLTMMPTGIARAFQFDRDTVYANLDETVPIQAFLKNRWEETNPQDATRILWDLALVEAYLLPQSATIREVATPPENTKRRIKVYTSIDRPTLTADFWDSLRPVGK